MNGLSAIKILEGIGAMLYPFSLWVRILILTTAILANVGKPALACHDTQITNLVTVDNGDGTFTYTMDITVEVGSFDGYGYGFALVFSNSISLPPTVLSSPGFTPTVTRPGYDPLIGYTGLNIGSGQVPFFSERYAGRSDVLTYETTDDWFGMGSTDYSATITVTVAGCIEEISVDGDFRSLGNGIGDPSCVHTISTGYTCCPGPIPTGIVNATICPGETFVYFGSVYDENNLSGNELLSTPLGCDSLVTVNVTVDQNCCDPQTSAISGPSSLCENATGNVFSVVNTPGSTYDWNVPAGSSITSGQGTNSITVDFGTNGGQISVVESLQCGDGPTVIFDVVLNPLQNLVVSYPAPVCQPNTVDLTVSSITAGSTGGGALSYWTDMGAIIPLSNPSSVATSGTYYIQAGIGNCADIEPVNVVVNNCVSCSMDYLTLTMSDCYASGQGNLEYDLEGVVAFSDAPLTGTLTITDCFGNQQVFNPPFTGSQQFSVGGLPQNGLNCDFSAVFSDDPNCTITTGFIAPPTITFFETNCVTGSGQVDGTISFNNAPATGTIVIEIFDGTSTQTANILPPFNSPESWQVTGLDPSATNYQVSYYFSDFPSCDQTQTIICGCSAVGGTTSASITGSGTNDFVLCDGDQLNIESNNDFVFPENVGPVVDADGNVYPYQPGYVYLVYTCQPTAGVFPGDDPCFEGVIPVEGSLTDINDPNSIFEQFPNGTFANNQLLYVPVTLYHYDPVAPAFIFNSNCWALGNPVSVTYLPPVVTDITESCQNNAISVSISGGYPEVFGGDFIASNLVPSTASFANSSTGNGGTIEVEGLQNGDFYSFDITDENGCPVTISGGPFQGLPIANAGQDAQSCGLDHNLSAVASFGSGSWSGGTIGTTFSASADANATVSVPTVGTYTFTWTEDNGNGCVASDEVEITFSEISLGVVVTDASCGETDGQIAVAAAGGSEPYSYLWSSGGTTDTESDLGVGNVTLTVTDNSGCSLDSMFTISQPVTFSYDLNSSNANCAGECSGVIDIQPDGIGPYTYTWEPNVSSSNSESNLCVGEYEILVTDQNGCTQVVNATITGNSFIQVQTSSDVNEVCIGQSAVLSSIVTGGTQPYAGYTWAASPADPSLVPTNPNPTVSPSVTTTYTLVVTDANGCVSAPKYVTVEVLPPLTLEVVLPATGDTSICPGGSVSIDVQASGGDGNWNIYLLPDDQNPATLPLEAQPSATSTYEFMVTDGCETPATYSSSTVTVLDIPEIQINAEPNVGCAPLTVEFSGLTPSIQNWTWNFGDPTSESNTANSEYPAHIYEYSGSYDVSLSITTAEGCSADSVFSNYVEVFDLPTAEFESSAELATLLNAEIDFTDLSQGDIDMWFWDFGDGQSSTDQNPTNTYTEPGTYPVVLKVITINGCEDETYLEIEVEPEFTFYIPNAFTPNGDRHNNFFRGYGEGVNWDTYSMSITNRWGEMIYQTNSIDSPWDGSFKGQEVELGVYVYEISFYDITGDDHYYYGHVKLVR